MKTAIQLAQVMLLFGGVSAGVTMFWQKQQSELRAAKQRAEVAEAKAAENPLADLQKPVDKPPPADEFTERNTEPPVAVRPPYVEGVDETSQLVVSLNQRLRATQNKERTLDERQEALKLIFADMRAEQTEINKLREHVSEELGKSSQSVQENLKAAQDERDLLRRELNSLRGPSATPDATAPAGQTKPSPAEKLDSTKTDSDPATLKRLGAIYDNMPAESVAEVLQQMRKQGREEAVVQLLQNMKDRQAAKVLGTIAATDAATAASLTEKLKHR